MAKVELVLNNLNCPHCSAKIEETVKKQSEFKNVVFNFVNKKMTMDSQLSEEETLSKVKGIVDSIEDGVDTVLNTKGNYNKVELVLNNLNCPNCSAKIEQKVKEQNEFKNVTFNFVNKKMTMDSQLSEEETLTKVKGIVDSIEDGVDTVLNVKTNLNKVVLVLNNLNCPHCSEKIEQTVKEQEEFENVVFNFVNKKMTLDSKLSVQDTLAKVKGIVDSIEEGVDTVLDENKKAEVKKTKESDFGKKAIARIIVGVVLMGGGIALNSSFGFLSEILFVLAYVVFGYDVVIKAVKNILKGDFFDENFLMSLATICAFVIGEWTEAVAVMLFYQVGEYFQSMAVDKSQKSIKGLLEIKADSVTVERNGEVQAIAPEEINIGDTIVVKAGEKVCVDGVITKGDSSFDMKALTGESVPVEKKQGDTVLSGSINTGAVIYMKAQKRFEDSTVARIIEMVENATANKSKTENFITKFAKIYTPVVVFLAVALTVLPTIVVGDFQQWLSRALVFLVASCPCALVLSVPLTFFSGIGAVSKKGALVKGSTYLQTLSGLNTLVVDKTGTITKGEFTVVETDGNDDVMKVAASLERFSNHPIAQAIVKSYKGDYIDFDTTEEIAGYGLMGVKDGDKYFVGSQRLMERENVALNNTKYNIYVSKNNEYYGAIKAEDTIKPDSSKAIADLKALGVNEIVMLTGDKQDIAEEIGEKAGVTKVYAGLLPQGKVEKVEEIYSKNNNAVVGAVGDGINDAPVLARADVGIAMGGIGSDAAIEAADIVIMNDELSKLPIAIKYARMTMKTVKENVWFALGVKAIVLILAALGYANMWLAVFADVGVALLAILNATKVMRK
jgi:Cd2+/Zn2+-exporting ATPase